MSHEIDQLTQIRRRFEEFKRGFSKQVRFAVRSPAERYSAAWMTFDSHGNFYIGARSVMGSQKISLHRSRICRLAFDKRYFGSAVERGLIPTEEDRVLVKWRRPLTPAIGAVLVVGLVFPTDFLHLNAPAASVKKPFIYLDAAPQGKAVEVAFFYSREPVTTLEPELLQFGSPLFWTDLGCGDMVWMVAREADFHATAFPSDEALNSISGRFLDRGAFEKASVERRNLTAHLWNAPNEHEPLILMEIGGVCTSGHVPTFLSSLLKTATSERPPI
jgi:hypothetical protein